MTDASVAEAGRIRDGIIEDVTLRELREMLGITQEELAKRIKASQSQLSQFESREDRKLSTLKKYVEALGGKLRVQAIVDGKVLDLAGI